MKATFQAEMKSPLDLREYNEGFGELDWIFKVLVIKKDYFLFIF